MYNPPKKVDPRLVKLTREGVKSVELWGESFNIFMGLEDGLPRFGSSTPRVTAGFLPLLKPPAPDRDPITLTPDYLRFHGRRGAEWQIELYPRNIEMNGATFMAALRPLSEDLAAQTARRVAPIASKVRWVEIGTIALSFPTFHVRLPDRVRQVVASLSRLDHRAFIFGEKGFTTYITLHLPGNRREILRLHPESFFNPEALRLKDPPLPLPLWQEIFLPDRKRVMSPSRRNG